MATALDHPVVASGPAGGRLGRGALTRRLILLYVEGSVAAVAVVLFLVFLGLQFNWAQWRPLLFLLPVTVSLWVVPDIYMIVRHFRPVGEVLETIGRGETPTPSDASRAMVRALNLPFLAFLRVTLFHGPISALSVVLTLVFLNIFFKMSYLPWQIFIFGTIVLFFASPTHAIFEFFAVSKVTAPVLDVLSTYCKTIEPEHLKDLRSTSLRNKLLYLAIFVTCLPLFFLGVSAIFKVDQLLFDLGVFASFDKRIALWSWVMGVVAVCMGGALAMSVLTASEVSRSAAKLIQAMTSVEQGDLSVRLKVSGTDEYADLFRGFNLMTDELREEAQILAMSQDLMGELHLDVLLERIIRATTELLDADRGTLFIYDRKSGQLVSRFAQGLSTMEIPLSSFDDTATSIAIRMKEIRIPANAGIAGAVFTSGKPENIADPHSDPRFNPEVDRRTGYRTESILAMPIFSKAGEIIGVTQVLNKRGGRFTQKDEQRLQAFTAQIAIALENARLFDDVLRMKNYNESILRSTSNGMITLDNERRIVTVNDATTSILRREQNELVGRTAAEVFGVENQWILGSLTKVETSGENDISVDADVHLSEGQPASVNLTAVPLIDANDVNIGSMLIFEDITSEKRVRSTMSRYMSKEVADQLLAGGETELGGKVQRISILFSDIRNFTTISEAIGARETVSMLNEYFAEMVDVVFQNGGILDKYIGDAIMALFGAPFNRPKDVDHAVAAANRMIVGLRDLNARRLVAGSAPIDIGVGISTGDAVVGNIGSPKRMEYTAIGDSVNLASRLEGATKVYGVKILLSEFTVAAMTDTSLIREVDLMRVKGKDQPVAIYEALEHHTKVTFPSIHETLALYKQGMELYRQQDWSAARKKFEAALRLKPDDGPSRVYVDRCLYYAENPPGADWNRVWVLKEK